VSTEMVSKSYKDMFINQMNQLKVNTERGTSNIMETKQSPSGPVRTRMKTKCSVLLTNARLLEFSHGSESGILPKTI